jgi:hypothetical protein
MTAEACAALLWRLPPAGLAAGWPPGQLPGTRRSAGGQARQLRLQRADRLELQVIIQAGDHAQSARSTPA